MLHTDVNIRMLYSCRGGLLETVGVHIDEDKAVEIATRFLELHYSICDIKQAALKDGIWTVKASIAYCGYQSRMVVIDARNGRVIDWHK